MSIKFAKIPIDLVSISNETMREGDYYLSVNQCPTHPNFVSLSLDNWSGGTRLLGSKCCGKAERIISWKLTSAKVAEIIDELSALEIYF